MMREGARQPRDHGSNDTALGPTLGLSLLTAALMATASLVPLLRPGIYRDNPLVTSGWLGNDLVTLFVAVPVTLFAVRGTRGGSIRARLVLMGMLAYAAYNFAFYLFGAAFNALFIVYVAVVALSLLALAFGAFALDASALRDETLAPSRRGVAAFILLVVIALGGFWLAVSLKGAITSSVPAVVIATGIHTNVIAALDLALIVPSGILAGVWLWKRRASGWVLGTIWTVHGAVYMSALAAATVTGAAAGHLPIEQAALWIAIGLGCLASCWRLLHPRPTTLEVVAL